MLNDKFYLSIAAKSPKFFHIRSNMHFSNLTDVKNNILIGFLI